ncbi:permease [Vallitalea pronyensis]|uniref:Permease n=1 Tax=Vallitalea pronyensis TaxID=1348613 RepID=A0A8J8ML45_9FIRM|nr:permease [Vallitalea pronyensis]QUI23407.1 permease [Vallitalea pronyensis]
MTMKKIIKNKTLLVGILILLVLSIYDISLGIKSLKSASFQILSMLKIVPPIFLLIGLLDVWVPRETMIKLMGKKSGVLGIVIAFLFGTFAAGPLVGAFPVAMIMLKKGARYANVIFFLMTWASSKLPILFYQSTTMGLKFTIVSNVTLIVVYLVGSLVLEKSFSKKELDALYEHVEEMAK